jgi:hypothetical protein
LDVRRTWWTIQGGELACREAAPVHTVEWVWPQNRPGAYLLRPSHFLNEIHLIEGASTDTTRCPQYGALAEVL